MIDKKKPVFFFVGLLSLLVLVLVIVQASQWFSFRKKTKALSEPTSLSSSRGLAGDFWADIEVGRRDFTEIVPNEVVPNKLFKPEGIIVDRSVSPGRAYIWDAGNSRILGLDLAKCYNSPSSCTADIIIGQPSGNDYGACNQDSSFQTRPKRPPSSASTLCGSSEQTHTVLEFAFSSSMEVDKEGNLFVPDALNNRVLKFIKPFETDTIADEVWGQVDFTGNLCNLSGSNAGPFDGPLPTASSLCYCSQYGCGMGVTLDSQGNLWVAEGGNNRVLRFPKDIITGNINKTADLVLGQPNFNTGSEKPTGSELNQMSSPQSLSLDKNGNLYVADTYNKRVLIFNPPFSPGMSATGIFPATFTDGPYYIKVDQDPDDPDKQIILTSENVNGVTATVKIWELDGRLKKSVFYHNQRSVGSIGIDALGNILNTSYRLSDVFVYNPQTSGISSLTKELFSPPYGYNQVSGKRFGTASWTGVAAVANQLIVGEGRLLFWNNPLSLTNGQPPDGYVGASSSTEYPNPTFTQIKSDSLNRIWISRWSKIEIYQAPLSTGALPVKIINSPLSVLGGGQIILDSNRSPVWGLAITQDSRFLWISQPDQSRVLRIRDPLTNPLVDIVLGQVNLEDVQCNQGKIGEHQYNVPLNMLCNPGNLSIDKKGNLYVSDHTVEVRGNDRVLMFSSGTFPDNPAQVIFAPKAAKEFPKGRDDKPGGILFETAFDSFNRMVGGYNPYSGYRFIDYFNDPTKINPNNPSDPAYAAPNGSFKDFYGWPIAATFDNKDNLYIYDANRGRVMIYKKPMADLPTPTVVTPTNIPDCVNLGRDCWAGSKACCYSQDGVAYGAVCKQVEGTYWTCQPAASTKTPTPAYMANLTFKIRFQGVNSQKPAKKIQLVLAQDGIKKYCFKDVNLVADNAGVYISEMLRSIAPGSYEVFVKGPSHLQKKFSAVLAQGGNIPDWTATPLPAGDITGIDSLPDNRITTDDITALTDWYTDLNAAVGTDLTNRLADLDFDGWITVKDLSLALSNYTADPTVGEGPVYKCP